MRSGHCLHPHPAEVQHAAGPEVADSMELSKLFTLKSGRQRALCHVDGHAVFALEDARVAYVVRVVVGDQERVHFPDVYGVGRKPALGA